MNITIGSTEIGVGCPAFIIAEIGINHNGSIDIALDLIIQCHDIGCNAVKFQKRTVPVVYHGELDTDRVVDQSIIDNARKRSVIENIEYQVFPPDSLLRLQQTPTNTTNGDLKHALEFGLKEFDMIDRECERLGMLWSASAWDGLSAHFVNGFNVQWIKIASPCLTHSNLLRRVCHKGKPVILSVGGSTMNQVIKAIEIMQTENDRIEIILLHCVSAYPTPDEYANINMIHTLQEQFPDLLVGYSGHEADDLASLLAVKHGACVVERHVTLDKNMPGSDHKVSLNIEEFSNLITKIRRLEQYPQNFAEIIGTENVSRVPVIEGSGVKIVLPKETEVMKKLRRVNDI